MKGGLKNFFYPESICIVGASSKVKSIGYELLRTILFYGYKGKIFITNPNAESILGLKCYPDIPSIEENFDLAIILVPKRFVEQAVDDLISKKVKAIVLITAGFKETGAEGEEIEKRILAKAKAADVRLVGPNCMGVINTLDDVKLNATFVAEEPEAGSTGFLSQSGALGAAILNSLRETDIKFAHFISVGNKADVNENDVIEYWQEDDNIKIITLYLESFVDGEEFIKKFIDGRVTKPVVVLKAGKTSGGMKAASSHTGALGSSNKVVDAVLDQFGIIRADNLNELFNTAKGFENFKLPKGNRIAVITNAGGPSILTVDSLEEENLLLANFSEETKLKLREVVHPEGSIGNPVDLLPGGTAENYKLVNEIVLADPNVDAVISIFVEPVMVQPMSVIEAINSIESEKPIFQVCMPMPEFWSEYRNKSITQKPIFKDPEEPAEIISNLLFYSKKHEQRSNSIKRQVKSEIIRKDYPSGFLSAEHCKKICEEYNIPMIRTLIVKPYELHMLYQQSDPEKPVVLKGINESVVHKSEFNAVKLNLRTREEVSNAASEIAGEFKKHGFIVDDYIIQPFVKTKHELLIGGFRDPSFGPMIMFGSGGKYVEVFQDTIIKSAYLIPDDVDEMINKTKIGNILNGVRGEKPVDLNKLKTIILAAAQMLLDHDEITEFDINPLSVDENNSFMAVDVRIRIS